MCLTTLPLLLLSYYLPPTLQPIYYLPIVIKKDSRPKNATGAVIRRVRNKIKNNPAKYTASKSTDNIISTVILGGVLD